MTRNDRIREVENAAYRWRGNSKMWSAWSTQLAWVDFKMRWLIRFYRFRKFWADLKPDPEFQRLKYAHTDR